MKVSEPEEKAGMLNFNCNKRLFVQLVRQISTSDILILNIDNDRMLHERAIDAIRYTVCSSTHIVDRCIYFDTSNGVYHFLKSLFNIIFCLF